MPRTWRDLTNQRFGLLTAKEPTVSPHELNGRLWVRGPAHWHCACQCGNRCVATSHALTGGGKRSCGCLRVRGILRHGQSPHHARTPEYRTWMAMKIRCNYNGHNKHYKDRGITVCRRWLESFEAFFEDMGLKPSQDHSIDRINVDGNYEPSNCRWATRKEQMANRRNTKKTPLADQALAALEDDASSGACNQ